VIMTNDLQEPAASIVIVQATWRNIPEDSPLYVNFDFRFHVSYFHMDPNL
jgi:hypothetical protein